MSSRMRQHNPDLQDNRGSQTKLSERDLDKIEDMIDKEGIEASSLPWVSMANEAGVEPDIAARTLNRRAASRDLNKRIAAEVTYKSEAEATRRLEFSTKAIKLRPNPEDWHDLLFSDEVHFGYGPQHKARIARKPGTRLDPSKLQERKQPEEGDKKRLHCWAAIGYDFKSDIVFYDSGNSNGKMTQACYEEQILEPYVKRWIEAGYSFVLGPANLTPYGLGRRR